MGDNRIPPDILELLKKERFDGEAFINVTHSDLTQMGIPVGIQVKLVTLVAGKIFT